MDCADSDNTSSAVVQATAPILSLTKPGQTNVVAYPNPARERLTVKLNGDVAANGRVVLRDQLGRTVITMPVSQLENQQGIISTAGLNRGVYFLQLEGNAAANTARLCLSKFCKQM